MQVGDLVRHRRFRWIGHVMSAEETTSRLCSGVYDKIYIVVVARSDGTLNKWPSIDLQVIDENTKEEKWT